MALGLAVGWRDWIRLKGLDQNLDAAPAWQTHPPSDFIFDAKGKHLGSAGHKKTFSLGDHVGLDASTRNRSAEVALVVDGQMAARRARSRAFGFKYRCDDDAMPGPVPQFGLIKGIALGHVGGRRSPARRAFGRLVFTRHHLGR